VVFRAVGDLERSEFNPCLHLALRIVRFFEIPVEFVSLDEFARIAPPTPDPPIPTGRASGVAWTTAPYLSTSRDFRGATPTSHCARSRVRTDWK